VATEGRVNSCRRAKPHFRGNPLHAALLRHLQQCLRVFHPQSRNEFVRGASKHAHENAFRASFLKPQAVPPMRHVDLRLQILSRTRSTARRTQAGSVQKSPSVDCRATTRSGSSNRSSVGAGSPCVIRSSSAIASHPTRSELRDTLVIVGTECSQMVSSLSMPTNAMSSGIRSFGFLTCLYEKLGAVIMHRKNPGRGPRQRKKPFCRSGNPLRPA